MKIEASVIQQIKETADIVEVVSKRVVLNKRGANLWGCCPFHDEKTPSLSVSAVKGIFKCFGCGKGGDTVTFVMESENCSYQDAILFLAQMYHIAIEQKALSPQEQVAQQHRESLLLTLNFAKELYEHNLYRKEQNDAMPYLKSRGFTDEIIRKFGVGYAMYSWDNLLTEATQNRYKLKSLFDTGLVMNNAEKNKVYDRFRDRIMFPIHDVSGNVIGFGGRIIKQTIYPNGHEAPKYLNSPETEIYHKSSVLYGLFQAKKNIRLENNVYLVEGYTDVLACHQAGIENVVASAGTSLTIEQVAALKKYTNQITILFDGDSPGLKAALRGIEIIVSNGINIHVVLFPDNHDPDSYLKKVGPEQFVAFVKQEVKDFVSFKASYYKKIAGNNVSVQSDYIKELVLDIVKLPDMFQRFLYLKKVAEIMEVPHSMLITQSNQAILERSNNEKPAFKREPRQKAGVPLKTQVPNNLIDKELLAKSDDNYWETIIPHQILEVPF